jgi:hypothetical protein
LENPAACSRLVGGIYCKLRAAIGYNCDHRRKTDGLVARQYWLDACSLAVAGGRQAAGFNEPNAAAPLK